jgi:arylsulfatase A-like enzyme
VEGNLIRSLLLTATIFVAGGEVALAESTGVPKNLIVITLDTTRADFLSAYDDSTPKRRDGVLAHSPAMDAIARDGTRFDLAISSSALTPVSHASILTGLDNREHGLRVLSAESGYRLRDDVPTLATVLKAEGYRTLAVQSAFPVASVFGFKRGFDVFESLETELPDRADEDWDQDTYQRRSDETTALALDRLEPAEEPYFLWVHYWDPHDPRKLPPRAYMKEIEPRLTGKLAGKELTATQKSRLHYATEVAYMDAQIERLMTGLAQRNLLRDTIIVIASDHGQGLGDHDWFHHRILYQEQIRIPLIISIPGHEQVPSVQKLVRAKDIFATVLDYMQISSPKPISARSLRPLIEGKPDANRIAFANQINGFDLNARLGKRRPLDDFVYVAMDADWKLIYRPNHPSSGELYNLSEDPLEARNLYSATHPEAIRLKKELAESDPWVTEPFGTTTRGVDMTEMREALEVLGYVSGDGDARSFEVPPWRWTCPEDPTLIREKRSDRGACSTPLIPIVVRTP